MIFKPQGVYKKASLEASFLHFKIKIENGQYVADLFDKTMPHKSSNLPFKMWSTLQ